MKIRLYVDEDSMSRSLVKALRARGMDILSAFEAGMVDRDDDEHLDFATANGRTLFSFNVGDFYEPHTAYLTEGKPHAGIILARQQVHSVGELTRRLLRIMTNKSAEEMADKVEFSFILQHAEGFARETCPEPVEGSSPWTSFGSTPKACSAVHRG